MLRPDKPASYILLMPWKLKPDGIKKCALFCLADEIQGGIASSLWLGCCSLPLSEFPMREQNLNQKDVEDMQFGEEKSMSYSCGQVS